MPSIKKMLQDLKLEIDDAVEPNAIYNPDNRRPKLIYMNKCLRCDKEFKAQSKVNKICSRCKDKDEWKQGHYQEITDYL